MKLNIADYNVQICLSHQVSSFIFYSLNKFFISHKKKSWNPHRNWFIKAATSAALCVCIITRFSSLFALFSLVNNYFCTKSLRDCVFAQMWTASRASLSLLFSACNAPRFSFLLLSLSLSLSLSEANYNHFKQLKHTTRKTIKQFSFQIVYGEDEPRHWVRMPCPCGEFKHFWDFLNSLNTLKMALFFKLLTTQ